jgi:hypothetical protein
MRGQARDAPFLNLKVAMTRSTGRRQGALAEALLSNMLHCFISVSPNHLVGSYNHITAFASPNILPRPVLGIITCSRCLSRHVRMRVLQVLLAEGQLADSPDLGILSQPEVSQPFLGPHNHPSPTQYNHNPITPFPAITPSSPPSPIT